MCSRPTPIPDSVLMEERSQSGQREGWPGWSFIAREVICHYKTVASGTCWGKREATHCNEEFTENYFVLSGRDRTAGEVEHHVSELRCRIFGDGIPTTKRSGQLHVAMVASDRVRKLTSLVQS